MTATTNFVINEFHNSDDCVIGGHLKFIGRKFKRLAKQNFIKIEGPASGWVHKAASYTICQSAKCSSQLKDFKGFGISVGDGFKKKKDLIVEPEESSDCPDYMGTSKHGGKAFGHTPSQSYNATSTANCIFAIGYIDTNRQKRSGNIELVKVENTKEYFKV